MVFTTLEIERLVAALSGGHPSRVALLPLIFSEWGRTELAEHLRPPEPAAIQAEIKQLKELARAAKQTFDAISNLSPDNRFAIAGWQLGIFTLHEADSETYAPNLNFNYKKVRKVARRLDQDAARLSEIAVAATQTAAIRKPLPMRHQTLVRYLILQDLAEISEYATGERASRKIRTEPHPQAGLEYGRFWDLASASWRVIFGSAGGLSSAVQSWAGVRTKHGERSPVIWNIALRHPEWEICPP
jgi:hypothetical protein